MKKRSHFEWLFLGLLVVVAVFMITCNGNGPATSDQFRRVDANVYYRSSSSSGFSTINDDNWRSYPDGSQLSTNDLGQAQLSLTSCTGYLYLFKDSGIAKVRTCDKNDYQAAPGAGANCVSNGTVLAAGCSAEFTTSGSLVTKVGSTFSITSLPEFGDVTIVMVFEGEVMVTPVLSYNPTVLGDAPTFVGPGQFTFTMPDDQLREVNGLTPRGSYTFDALPLIADVYPIREWTTDIYQRTSDLGLAPDNWPEDMRGQGEQRESETVVTNVTVQLFGPELNSPDVQSAVYTAIDWTAIQDFLGPEFAVQVQIGDTLERPENVLVYDPGQTRAIFEEFGYPEGIPLTVLIPEGNSELERVAQGFIAENLKEINNPVEISMVPAFDLDAIAENMIQAGENIMILRR